jgi:predicted nucleic acid-binding protein
MSTATRSPTTSASSILQIFGFSRELSISAAARVAELEDLARLPITVDTETASRAWRDTATLADRYRLTLYDASYLELSIRLSIPLATFDAALRRAATAAGVVLL